MFKRRGYLKELSNMTDKNAMDFYSGRYFIVNMNMLRLTGLWPYQNNFAKLIIRVIFTVMIIIPSIPHIISAYIHQDDVELLIQGMGAFFYFISMGTKYFSMLITEEKLKFLYKNMVQNWKMLANQAENDILAKSSETGRLLTMGYLAYIIGAVQLFVSLPLAPGMVNMIYPLFNDSDRMLLLNGEYLVDKDKYYYYIYLFESFTCFMTVPMFGTIDSTYAVCVQQCVGLLEVVKFRLEVATKSNMKSSSIGHPTIDVAREAIIKSAELHEKVLNFGRILESSYSTSFLFVMVTSTCMLVTTSVGILFNMHRPLFFVRFICLLNGYAIHIFYLSWPGQKTIDSSDAIFYAAYNNEWYECSVESQRLLKLIMRRTMKPFCLTAGGFFVMSFETFEMLMKTVVSYIAVLASFV